MTLHAGAEVADDVILGDGTTLWPLGQIREGTRPGDGCIIGRRAYVGSGVVMGDNCKLQNYALVYEPAVLEDDVFGWPAVVFTNDYYPRAIPPKTSSNEVQTGSRSASRFGMVPVSVPEPCAWCP